MERIKVFVNKDEKKLEKEANSFVQRNVASLLGLDINQKDNGEIMLAIAFEQKEEEPEQPPKKPGIFSGLRKKESMREKIKRGKDANPERYDPDYKGEGGERAKLKKIDEANM